MDNNLLLVIFFSLVGGVFSLIGGVLLLAHKKGLKKFVKYATPFAAGALLAAAFADVLPEAAHDGNVEMALKMTMAGIVASFLVERFIHWFHHHNHSHNEDKKQLDATTPLIIFGDTAHNFVDGIAIAAAFLIDVPTGIVTTLAVAAHEIPHEIGDFAILLEKGMSRMNVLKVNFYSALATTVGAVIFYQIGHSINLRLDLALGLIAGFFIYIAVSDIIPSIHKSEGQKFAGIQTFMLIFGILAVSIASTTLHGHIEGGHEHNSEHSQVQESHENESHENDDHVDHDHAHED